MPGSDAREDPPPPPALAAAPPQRRTPVSRRIGLGLLGICLGLGAAEIAARFLAGTLARDPGQLSAEASARGEDAALVAARRLTIDASIDVNWVQSSPPPLPRQPIDPLVAAVDALALDPRVPRSERFRAWNARHLPQPLCQRLPDELWVFDPPQDADELPYRFLPSTTTPLGLTTNAFGWRGPAIEIDKPPRTIRLAFAGASTTVGLHDLPFSYPELVVHWLNLWAAASGHAVRFEGINAGREGLGSTAIAAVIRDEILPMEPDAIIYYEGANQFPAYRGLLSWRPQPRPLSLTPPPSPLESRLLALGDFSTLAVFLANALRRLSPRSPEPAKPPHRFAFASDFDPATASLWRQDLPLDLPRILQDLDWMARMAAAHGAVLLPSSFVWLARDGMQLHPEREWPIWRQLNRDLWPLRYAEVRQLADLQNLILARFARAHSLPFIDVAGVFPAEPRLFVDAIHLNAGGTRLHAWIVFSALVPWLRPQIESGVLPRRDEASLAAHPGIGPIRRMRNPCRTAAGEGEVAGEDERPEPAASPPAP